MSSEPPVNDALVREQVYACQRVLDFVRELTENWKQLGGRTVEPDAGLIIATVFSRSTRTYEAVVKHLGNRGFGEQGAMLDRSLFEDMVDAHWVSLNPELALERVRQHDHWSRVLGAEVHRNFPEYVDGQEPEVDEPCGNERKLYTKLFGRWGAGSWTGLDLHARVEQVEPCWTEEEARRQFRFIYAWVHKLNNETLHVSAYSLARVPMAPRDDRGAWRFRLGSTREMLTQTLFSALWSYTQTLTLVFDTFGSELHERLDGEFTQPAMKQFLPLVDEEAEDD